MAAAAAYRRAVIPFNEEEKRLFDKYKNTTALTPNRTFCKGLGAATKRWIAALRAVVWPTDTAADAKQLIRYEAAALAHLNGCQRAKTVAQWDAEWSKFESTNSHAAEYANLVRLDIGLKPVAG